MKEPLLLVADLLDIELVDAGLDVCPRRGDLLVEVPSPAGAFAMFANLAAVPSIIYGLLGLGLFVRAMGMGRSVIAGASTLALLVLPVVILSTREALRAVPSSHS